MEKALWNLATHLRLKGSKIIRMIFGFKHRYKTTKLLVKITEIPANFHENLSENLSENQLFLNMQA